MIKLLRGFYDNDGVEMTPQNGPFEVADNKYRTGAEREAQLVASGVAAFIGGKSKTVEPEEASGETEAAGIPEENPEEGKKETKRRARR